MFSEAKEVLNIINNSAIQSEARFVGGCVRDCILGIANESSDIDIATNISPQEVSEIFENLGVRVVPTGLEFGTVTIVFKGKNYEITSLRKDINPDGRHTKVEYSKSWEEDASRRDLTFNAMYMDVHEQIYDYHNGAEDLKNGLVKFIGEPEKRIKEDYLRILRMFRFYAYFGKDSIPQSQLDICKKLCESLDKISGERIKAEMLKMFSSNNYNLLILSIESMIQTGVMQKLTNLDKSYYDLESLKRLLSKAEQGIYPISVLCSFINRSADEELLLQIADRWRLSNKQASLITRLNESLELDFADEYQVRKSIRINQPEEFKNYSILNFAKGRIDKQKLEALIEKANSFKEVEFPINSQDFIKIGFKPSKELGSAIRKAEEIWERSDYKMSKDEILNQVSQPTS